MKDKGYPICMVRKYNTILVRVQFMSVIFSSIWRTALGDFLFPEDSSAKLQRVLTLLISTVVKYFNNKLQNDICSNPLRLRAFKSKIFYLSLKQIHRKPPSVERYELIEDNAKCRRLKNWTVKGLCGRYLSVRGPAPHTTTLLQTVYVYTVYLFTQGRG